MAHLRRATLGLGIDRGNTHPFTDGRVASAHSGSVLPPAALDALVPGAARAPCRGTTEALYASCRVNPDGPLGDDDPEYDRLRYRTGPEPVVVSSSGWGRDWQELSDGDLLVVRRRTLDVTVASAARLSTPR
jgi:hypothetical protein